jgi:uncharacterized protein
MGVTPQANKKLAMLWLETGLKGEFERWQSMMHDNFRYWHGAGEWHDKSGYIEISRMLSQDLITGNYTMEIGSVTAEDDRVVIEAETNYEVQNGKHYRNWYVWVLQIRDGKILLFKGHHDTHHAHRVFSSDVSVEDDARQSPVEEVIMTLRGPTPHPLEETAEA